STRRRSRGSGRRCACAPGAAPTARRRGPPAPRRPASQRPAAAGPRARPPPSAARSTRSRCPSRARSSPGRALPAPGRRARRASGRSGWRRARVHCAMNAVTWGTETCIPPPTPCTQCNFPLSLVLGGIDRGRSGGQGPTRNETGDHPSMGHTDGRSSEASDSAQPAVNPIVVMSVLLAGAFVIILNQTLLNTALPAFMADFGITANTAQWVTTLFMLVNGIMIPATAFLIQKFTTRTMFFAAMGIFALGTVICAIAPVYAVLLLGRIVQAASGGMIMPLMQTILFAIFPIHKRGTAMGTFGLVISFAPALGPTLSGFIVDHWTWRVLFA